MKKVLIFRISSLLSVVILLLATIAWAESLRFELESGSAKERATQRQIKKLVAKHDLGAWLFTRHILVDEGAIPHSHPVLTLHTRHLGEPERLLSTFLHEQIHWLFSGNEQATKRAKDDLRDIYARLPVGYPDGGRTSESSYLHLLVILFEYESLRHFLGAEPARNVMRFWSGDHYRRLYSIVLERHDAIRQVAARHGFTCCPPEGPEAIRSGE